MTFNILHEKGRGEFSDFLANLNTIDLLNVGYFIIDSHLQTIEFAQKCYDLFPLMYLDTLDYEKMFHYLTKESAQKIADFFIDSIEKKQANPSIEFGVRQEGTMPKWVRCSLQELHFEEKDDGYFLGIFEDITEQKNNKMIIESCLDGTFVSDLIEKNAIFDGKIFNDLTIEKGFCSNASQTFNNMVYEKDREYRNKYMNFIIENQITQNRIEYRVNDKAGNPMWISNRNCVIYDEDGQFVYTAGGYIDIKGLDKYNNYIKLGIETDETTGLYNRFRLIKDFSPESNFINESGFVIFIRLDDFGKINDLLGVEKSVLFQQEIGNILTQKSFKGSRLYHYENDSFVVVLPSSHIETVTRQMNQYSVAVNRAFLWDGVWMPYRISMAAVAYFEKESGPENILNKCRIAIESIPEDAEERTILYEEKVAHEYLNRINFEHQLRKCVAENMKGFFLLYQPFIQAKNNRCIGAEALLRWKDENGKIISPVQFIPVLEELGLMHKVGLWVFETAAKQCKTWLDNGFDPEFYISVNVSPCQFTNPDIASIFFHYLKKIGLPCKNIMVEITETALMLNVEQGIKHLDKLKEYGVVLAIDDFGTGYSSLSYLKDIPVEKIKIDRSFVNNIDSDSVSRDFISSVIQITKNTGYVSCIEGVENLTQVEILKEKNIDVFQGFYFSRPQPANRFEIYFHRCNC